MSKWLTDEELGHAMEDPWVHEHYLTARAFLQAKEANRLRAGLEKMKGEAAKQRDSCMRLAGQTGELIALGNWTGMSEANEVFADELSELLEGGE